ncbi:TolC family protein [Dokdonella sp.]|uniref:TolC family protein n=1 Tax=Dokdonella sp. TaxID=2291710 RepID=UPI002CF3604F|nr:TolC family protein [Dokdonella sp.]HOZ25747.1 TolC family protein [Hyphomonadaceae bacterium]HPN80629.1 TolC family protein [Dokdonella sp.]
MKRWPLLCVLAVSASAMAAADNPSDLPPSDTVARWLGTDPSVQEAGFGQSVASREAGMLRASPNEWTLRATGQRREYEAGTRSREWNAGVERTIRLPGKRTLDTRLGESGIAVADARYAATTRQALKELTGLWLDWCTAVAASRLADQQVELAQRNRAGVDKRIKAGDAARLDLNLAEADVADVERLRSEAHTNEMTAKARLLARFGDIPAEAPALSEPDVDTQVSAADRIALLVSRSLELRIAEAERAQADLGVARQRADRLPDPTFGVFGGTEAFGNERIVGVTVSVPLPGHYRSEKLGRALSERDQRDAALAREKQQVAADAAALVTAERGGVERWRLARVAAQRSEENVRLVQRAYTLGEADLQTLLLARRQSLEAARTALDAHAAALNAQYRARIESGELWAELANAS